MKMLKSVLILGMILALSAGMPLSGWAEKTTITMMFDAVQKNHDELYQEYAQKYMKAHPDVEVNVKYGPKEVTDLLGLFLQFFEAKSSEVDIYGIDIIWPGDIATHLVDLYEYGARDVIKDYFPVIVQNNTVNGRLVGIPFITNAPVLYYRTDLLKKYGYAGPPDTWDKLTEMAKKIQEGERAAGNQDFWGFVFQGKAYEGLTCDALEWIASSGGGTIVEPDGTITINNPNAIKAIKRAAEWVGTIAPPGVTGFAEEDSRSVWQAGNAAFMRNWPYAYTLGNKDDSPIKGKFEITTLPGEKPGQSAGTLGGLELAVSKYSKNPKIAANVALFFAGKEFLKAMTIRSSEPPTIISLYKDPDVLQVLPFFEKMEGVLLKAVARPSTATAPKYNETSRLFFKAVHDVLTQKKNAETAMEELEADLKELLE